MKQREVLYKLDLVCRFVKSVCCIKMGMWGGKRAGGYMDKK